MPRPANIVAHIAAEITPAVARQALMRTGFSVFESGPWDVTLFGIRSTDTTLGIYDDLICALYPGPGGVWELRCFPGTTDPGLYYAEHLLNSKGVAILQHGIQFRGAWQVGLHKSRVPALVQRGKVKVWRDPNKDNKRDHTTEDEGLFGINIHPGSAVKRRTIGKWSAGCQVIADPEDNKDWWRLIQRSAAIYGDRFSYGIITQAAVEAQLG